MSLRSPAGACKAPAAHFSHCNASTCVTRYTDTNGALRIAAQGRAPQLNRCLGIRALAKLRRGRHVVGIWRRRAACGRSRFAPKLERHGRAAGPRGGQVVLFVLARPRSGGGDLSLVYATEREGWCLVVCASHAGTALRRGSFCACRRMAQRCCQPNKGRTHMRQGRETCQASLTERACSPSQRRGSTAGQLAPGVPHLAGACVDGAGGEMLHARMQLCCSEPTSPQPAMRAPRANTSST